ncbi:uncharacterized protein PV09_03550 [Verruconis gallopava]|uniref:Zn(2)-C6 fungal-type domain-containing protein n=1 Tax=Verruconis gallopava TaxID=253628 RepID=A0A0D2AFE4_9PEZI|nr:uncharacterized protein PV09_03550 [Verruconis gallopava]KIW05688.1 hypothetical protein PV09_03550 [Verruconis gallopava]
MKRPKVKGCYECSRRRIDCDRAEPECRKCQTKGLKCSGLGIRYRFNGVQGPKRRAAPSMASRADQSACRMPLPQEVPCSHNSGTRIHERRHSGSETTALYPCHRADWTGENQCEECRPGISEGRSDLAYDKDVSDFEDASQRLDGRPRTTPLFETLDHLDAPTRELLSYFSLHVASKMAVIDQGFNGFRDLVLPLAEHDLLVRRAVLVASNQHLSLRTGGLIKPCKRLYSEVVQGLIAQSHFISRAASQFETSLVAILLLLTTEMIIGGEQFGVIYETLRRLLCAGAGRFTFADTDLGRFLKIQTSRFQLSAESLLNEVEGALFLSSQAEKCLEFLDFCLSLHPEHKDVISDLQNMIRQACRIYVHRALANPPAESMAHLVEQFKRTAERIERKELGQHVLTWSYFVVAAESSNAEHRRYFVERINDLHRFTGFHNTIRGLRQLEGIWNMQSSTRWTALLGGPAQVLIM